MTLRHRRIIYLSFFLIFFIAAPIILLYAAGYRYNLKKGKLEKTGILFLESKPGEASIYLNKKLQDGKTPGRLNNLLPNDYLVEIKKEGYLPWQKTLAVYPSSTTFVQHVRLFKQETPLILLNDKVSHIKISLDQKKIIYILLDEKNISTIGLLDLVSNQTRTLTKIENYIEDIKWALSNQKILLKLKNGWLVLNLLNPNEPVLLLSISLKTFEKVKWDEESDNILYGISEGRLHKINLVSGELTKLLNIPILDYYLTGNNIYYLESYPENSDEFLRTSRLYLKNSDKFLVTPPYENVLDHTWLKKTNLVNLTEIEEITFLPWASDYNFIKVSKDLIILHDLSHKLLYLVRPQFKNSSQEKEIISEVSQVQLSVGEKMLLYFNDFEIWVYYPGNELQESKKELMTRLATGIEEALWYPFLTHVIFATSNTLKIIELENKRGRNVIELIKLGEIRNIIPSPKGDKLYFIGKIGSQEGIYILEIQ